VLVSAEARAGIGNIVVVLSFDADRRFNLGAGSGDGCWRSIIAPKVVACFSVSPCMAEDDRVS
jgi:hypothetical protein